MFLLPSTLSSCVKQGFPSQAGGPSQRLARSSGVNEVIGEVGPTSRCTGPAVRCYAARLILVDLVVDVWLDSLHVIPAFDAGVAVVITCVATSALQPIGAHCRRSPGPNVEGHLLKAGAFKSNRTHVAELENFATKKIRVYARGAMVSVQYHEAVFALPSCNCQFWSGCGLWVALLPALSCSVSPSRSRTRSLMFSLSK